MTNQHWYTYAYMVLFVFAALGANISLNYKLRDRAIYAGFLMIIWLFLIIWTWQ